MRKTKKLLALAIAVVMTVSLFSFLGLNSSAAPVNFATPAQGATATSSAWWGPAGSPSTEDHHGPAVLIDGDATRRWAPYGDTTTPYFIIDLGQTRSVTSIELDEFAPFRTGAGADQATFRIYLSNVATGDAWGTPVYTGPEMGSGFTHNLAAATNVRRVRVVIVAGADMPNRQQPAVAAIRVLGTAAGEGSGETQQPPAFVPVTSIPNFNTSINPGATLSLPTQALPANANHRAITWSIVTNTIGATLTGNTLTTHATNYGTITIRATVANGAAQGTAFTRDFNITVAKGAPQTGEPGVIIAGLSIAAFAMAGIAVLAKKTAATEV